MNLIAIFDELDKHEPDADDLEPGDRADAFYAIDARVWRDFGEEPILEFTLIVHERPGEDGYDLRASFGESEDIPDLFDYVMAIHDEETDEIVIPPEHQELAKTIAEFVEYAEDSLDDDELLTDCLLRNEDLEDEQVMDVAS